MMRYLLLSLLLFATQATVIAKTNVALNKPYTLSHPPNYPYCTDGGDTTDLTDGVGYDPKGTTLWTQKGTVGWAVGAQFKTIDIDLQTECNLHEVTFQTAADARTQGTFPLAVMVFTSNDATSYQYAGELINEAVDQSTYIVHTYKLTNLDTSGRYVRLLVVRGGFYVFCSEIEVFGTKSTTTNSTAGMTADETIEFAQKRSPLLRQFNSSLTLFGQAFDFLARYDESHPTAVKRSLSQLKILRNLLNQRVESEIVDFRRGIPFTKLDLQICQVIGKFLQTIGSPPLAVSATNPWKHHLPFDLGGSAPVNLLATLQGEWAELCWNVTNATPEPMELDFSITGLPSEAISVQQTIFVEAFGFRTRADALMPLTTSLTLSPGITSQIWLTIDTRNLLPGDYRGELVLKGHGNLIRSPIRFKVSQIPFPNTAEFDVNTFGYMHWPLPKADLYGTAQNMHEHYMNNHMIVSSYLPHPRVNANGDPIGPMDFTMLDQYMAKLPNAKRWTLFMGFEWDHRKMYPRDDDPKRKKIFQQWLREVIAHLKAKGLSYDNFNFLWVDEPSQERIIEIFAPSTKALREVDPKAQVWIDVTGNNTEESISKHPDLADIWCPGSDKIHWEFWKDKTFWYYDSASEKSKSPTSHYRHKLWLAFKSGATGNAFWTYTDDADPWDDYAGTPSYGVIYDNPNGQVISSKRLEAYRAGIEDYQLCLMVRKAVLAAAQAGHSTHPKVREAEDTLSDYLKHLDQLRTDEAWSEIAHVKLINLLEAISDLPNQ